MCIYILFSNQVKNSLQMTDPVYSQNKQHDISMISNNYCDILAQKNTTSSINTFAFQQTVGIN